MSGVLDAGYNSFSAQDGTAAKVTQKGLGYSANDTSRLQIKAVEDIGGGLKGGVTIESTLASNPRGNFGFKTDATKAPVTDFSLTGSGQTVDATRLGDRIMTVDLTMGAHTINAGQQAQPTRSVAVGFQADGSNLIGNLVGNDSFTTGRIPAVTYTFNAGNGLTAGGSYLNNTKVNSNSTDNSKTGNGYAVKAEYANGPLAAGGVWTKQTTNNVAADSAAASLAVTAQLLSPVSALLSAATTNTETTASVLGVSYDLAPVKVYGQHSSIKVNNTMNALTGDSQRHATSLGARYMIGDSYFFAQVSNGKNRIKSDANDYNWKGHSFGYKHYMSKRTLAYVGVGKAEYGTSTTTKATGKETAFGIQHNF